MIDCTLNRYGIVYLWGERQFTLEDFLPQLDECKYLLLKVVEQSIRDYSNLEHAITPIEKQHFESARDFIFDDSYQIYLGEYEVNMEDILGIMNLDIEWFRDRVHELKASKAEVAELLPRSKLKTQE